MAWFFGARADRDGAAAWLELAHDAPVLAAAMREVKACKELGTLPLPGGLRHQPESFLCLVEWLMDYGILDAGRSQTKAAATILDGVATMLGGKR